MLLNGIKILQGNHEFLLQKIQVRDLKLFTKFTERILMGLDDDNKPIYNDYFQRKLDQSKVNKIADYLIDDQDSIFPTNIVLAIPEDAFEIDNETTANVEFTIKAFVLEQIQHTVYVTIVDGQHRIRGIEVALERLTNDIEEIARYVDHNVDNNFRRRYTRLVDAKNKLLNFELIVTFILNATIDYQAMVFSTINRTQTKVSENLVQSLFGLTDKESPQKTALEIALSLNAFPNSPFFKRVKLFGHSRDIVGGDPIITQSSFVKAIVKLISKNTREAERDRYRNRRDLQSGITPELCFRKYYAQNSDQKIVNILFSYFKSVSDTFRSPEGSSYWSVDNNVTRNILQTTVGFEALLFFLPEILVLIPEEQRELPGSYTPYLQRAIGIDFADLDRYPFTSISRKKLIDDLRLRIFPTQ